jgi:hypothetical protein
LTTTRRFQIKRDGWVRPLLWPFGGTESRSYLEITPDGLHLRFGWFFDKRISFAEIESVRPGHWPWWGGMGWRCNLVGRIGLVGSYSGIVDLTLRRRHWVWMALLPLPCDRYTVSLEDPQGFVGTLSERLARAA